MQTIPQNKPRTTVEFRQYVKDEAQASAPKVQWNDFVSWFDWRQGQHVGLIGPTGSGKTTFALAMLLKRKYIVALATKPHDETLDYFGETNEFIMMRRWEKCNPALYPKRILWPDARDLYSAKHQRTEFQNAFRSIYREGGWCVYVDELWFIIHHLKLALEIRTYLQQARSMKISLVLATQRPAFVPTEVYDQSTWLFFWRDNDETNLKRISGISWLSKRKVQTLVANLDEHEVLAINTRTGDMVRTIAPTPNERIGNARTR